MKQFIITLISDKNAIAEYRHFCSGLPDLVNGLAHLRYRVRAVEEIPYESNPDIPNWKDLTAIEAEPFRYSALQCGTGIGFTPSSFPANE